MRLVEHDGRKIGVFNCDGALYAIEDRCSHDDGPLAEGEFDADACTVECPRHGSLFDLRSGRPKILPASRPVGSSEPQARTAKRSRDHDGVCLSKDAPATISPR